MVQVPRWSLGAMALGVGLLTVSLTGAASRAHAVEYWVSVTGSDGTGNGSHGKPWRHIQYAVNQILEHDATLNAMPGTYTEQVVVQQLAAGLRLLGAGASVTTIDAGGVSANGGVIKLNKGEGYVISGFTLTGGTYEGSGSAGGAIRGLDPDVSATVTRNVVVDNRSWFGGGAVNLGPNCLIRNNQFVDNATEYDAGAVQVGAGSLIEGNLFQGNEAGTGYGAVYNPYASTVIRGNTFIGNRAGWLSSGTGAYLGKGTVDHNLFVGNSAASFNDGNGGAVHLTGGTFVGNTLVGNIGDPEGAASGVYVEGPSTVVNNIIVNGVDGVGLHVLDGVSATIDYNDIWNNDLGQYGGAAVPGPHDIHADPLFADVAAGGCRLRSCNGRWTGTKWVRDSTTSPCIDAGDPNSPWASEPAPNGGRFNMGYDGNTGQASKSSLMASHAPLQHAARAPVATSIVITFLYPVLPASAEQRFSLTPEGGAAVTGDFTWGLQGRKMTFKPASPLPPRTECTVLLGAGIRPKSGPRTTWEESFSFTTAGEGSVVLASLAVAPTRAGGAQIVFSLSAPATLQARVLNLAGRCVRALCEAKACDAGANTLLWNAQSDAGLRVPNGTYLVEVIAQGADGTSSRGVQALTVGR